MRLLSSSLGSGKDRETLVDTKKPTEFIDSAIIHFFLDLFVVRSLRLFLLSPKGTHTHFSLAFLRSFARSSQYQCRSSVAAWRLVTILSVRLYLPLCARSLLASRSFADSLHIGLFISAHFSFRSIKCVLFVAHKILFHRDWVIILGRRALPSPSSLLQIDDCEKDILIGCLFSVGRSRIRTQDYSKSLFLFRFVSFARKSNDRIATYAFSPEVADRSWPPPPPPFCSFELSACAFALRAFVLDCEKLRRVFRK